MADAAIRRKKTGVLDDDVIRKTESVVVASGSGREKSTEDRGRGLDLDPDLDRCARANRRIERGEVEAGRQAVDQAAVYVHKKFGHSKKFSQGDKNDLIRSLAVKLEADRREFRSDVTETEARLAKARLALKQRDVTSSAVVDSLLAFHRKHERRLSTHAHGRLSTTDFLLNMTRLGSGSLAGLDVLLGHFEDFLTSVDVVVYVIETLARERETSFRLLGAGDDCDVTDRKLDELIAERLEKGELLEPESENLDDVIRAVTSEVVRMESAVEKGRERVNDQRDKLEKAEKTILELKKQEKPRKVPTNSQPRAQWA